MQQYSVVCSGLNNQVSKLKAEVQQLQDENFALKQCALKYLSYLNIPEPEEALTKDMHDPEMLDQSRIN